MLNSTSHKYSIGLALSGGGMRGIAHLGVLQALLDAGIKPDVVSGTSMGAIIGALYCSGYSPKEILSLTSNLTIFGVKSIGVNKSGILKQSLVIDILRKFILKDDFSSLKIPLFVCATSLNSGEATYFSHGTLFDKIQASAAIPIVFSPIEINHSLYVDGGLTDNLPIEPLIKISKKLIGSNCNDYVHNELNHINTFSIAERVFNIAISNTINKNIDKLDMYFDPPGFTKYSMFNEKKRNIFFEEAYNYASKLITLNKI